jgi:hypothetical protein
MCGCEWGGKGMPARCVCGFDYSAESMREGMAKLNRVRVGAAAQLAIGGGLVGAILPFAAWAEGNWVGIAIFVLPTMFAVGFAAIVRGGVKLAKATRRLRAVREMGKLPVARLR